MSSDPRLVPMDLFLQDQKRQDSDLRDTRLLLSRQVENVVSELRGMREDGTKQTAAIQAELQKQTTAATVVASHKAEEDKEAFTRRERLFAFCAIAVPVIVTFVLRLWDSL